MATTTTFTEMGLGLAAANGGAVQQQKIQMKAKSFID
jgi:hypothetical protein